MTNVIGYRVYRFCGPIEAFMEANSGGARRQSIIFSCVARIEISVCRCSAGSVFGRHAFDSLHCETADKPRFQSTSTTLRRHGRSTNRFLRTSGTPDELECTGCAEIPVGARSFPFWADIFGTLLLASPENGSRD